MWGFSGVFCVGVIVGVCFVCVLGVGVCFPGGWFVLVVMLGGFVW